jgi:light-regulated signal transduction histidine kinase (bacteriophytochrome)
MWVIGQAEIITRGDNKEILCTITDISSIKKIETELKNSLSLLEQSNKELEQFAYIASHDLQEPLRMVSSYTQLLAKKYKDVISGDGVNYINFAVDGAQRMQLLINDLLDYSRITRQERPIESVSTAKVLGVVISNLRKKIEESGAVITNDLMPPVMGNEQQIMRVFQNLIENAIKYRSDEAPRIHISAQVLGDSYCFSVTDNGIGIEEDYREKIFEIFERLHSATAYPGTGIGLAICKKVIEKLNGSIWVESNPDNGVTFYFTLRKGNG